MLHILEYSMTAKTQIVTLLRSKKAFSKYMRKSKLNSNYFVDALSNYGIFCWGNL